MGIVAGSVIYFIAAVFILIFKGGFMYSLLCGVVFAWWWLFKCEDTADSGAPVFAILGHLILWFWCVTSIYSFALALIVFLLFAGATALIVGCATVSKTDKWERKKQKNLRKSERFIAKVQMHSHKLDITTQVGDIVTFGHNTSAAGAYESGTINWIVLAKENDQVLLLTRCCIEHLPYHDQPEIVGWKDASIRKWLNAQFLQNYFSASETENILETPTSLETRDKKPAWQNVLPGGF